VLLGIIGAKMIKESFENDSCELSADFSWRSMLPMAVATSIDALAIGVSFAFLKVDIWWSVLMIGITTGLFSAGGVYIGNAFGCRFKSKAELVGGAILCIMGVKILIEHTMLL
jgi:putative Mn2+ efflux pump MntP